MADSVRFELLWPDAKRNTVCGLLCGMSEGGVIQFVSRTLGRRGVYYAMICAYRTYK